MTKSPALNLNDDALEKRAWTMYCLLKRLDTLVDSGVWPDSLTNLVLRKHSLFSEIHDTLSEIERDGRETT